MKSLQPHIGLALAAQARHTNNHLSGMSYGSDIENICYGSISTPMTLYLPSTSDGETVPGPELIWLTSIVSDGQTLTTWTFNTTTLTTGLMVAEPIIVGWMQSDLPSFPTPYASSLAQRIGIPFTASPGSLSTLAPPTGTSSPETAGKSNSLSSGAIAGIVIGTASAIILGMALLWFVLRRRRAAARLDDEPKAAEMEDEHAVLSMRKMFVGGKWRSEAGEEGSRHEMESGGAGVGAGVAVELDGRGVVELGVQGVRRELE
ncbi:hypothetical protein BS50DRAFT_624040 [Corynespora cassiicola Philippines]|uniref:Peptidase A1 domain-containing protein n=1 Tax=Corynespora cassiicola Philippines TaxID=1448308 RepID=A0A2T2NCV5_CORCC|nr:hypothetical protein BS50DRAFT_624040 [Corynespora cassiicola Philippines]